MASVTKSWPLLPDVLNMFKKSGIQESKKQ